MRDFTRKLRQKRGASAVFALAIFLIAALFSFTMVEGALTAAQNAYMQHEEEQAYLSVTSAARLFCHEAEFSISLEIPASAEQYETPFDWAFFWENRPNEPWKIYRDSDSLEVVGGHLVYDAVSQTWTAYYFYDYNKWMLSEEMNLIQKTLLDMTKAIDQGTETPQTKTLTITYPQKTNPTLADADKDRKVSDLFKQVETKVTMNPDYSVKAEFVNVKNPRDDSDIAQRLKYHVTVTLKCRREEPEPNVNANPVIVTRNLTWTVDSVGKGRYSA